MAYADYDFSKHQGVSPATARSLKKRFTSWEDIAEALPEAILEVKGTTETTVVDLQDTARAMVKQEARRARAGEESIVDRGVLAAPAADLRKLAPKVASSVEERDVAKKMIEGKDLNAAEEKIVSVLMARAREKLDQRYILSGKPADHAGPDGAGKITNRKMRRKLLNDGLCNICGMDFVDKRGLGTAKDFDGLSSESKEDIRKRVAAHKDMVHGIETALVISGVDMIDIGSAEGAGR